MPATNVVAIFANHESAEVAIRSLHRAGFDMHKLSIVGKGYHGNEGAVGFYTTGLRLKTWGRTGVFWGAMFGLLFGVGVIWVRALGTLSVAGPLASTVFSALEGASADGGTGLLAAALASVGVSLDDAVKYEADVVADRFLLVAHGDAEQVGRVRALLGQARKSTAMPGTL